MSYTFLISYSILSINGNVFALHLVSVLSHEDVSYKSTEFMSRCKLLVQRKAFIQQINNLSNLGFCFPLIFTDVLNDA